MIQSAGFIALSLIAALSSGLTMARLRRQFGLLQKLGAYTLERQIISNPVLHTPAPRVSASLPHVSEALDSLIAACLEKDRSRRPLSADAVIEALDRLASRLAWTQRDATAWWEAFGRRNDKPPSQPAPTAAH